MTSTAQRRLRAGLIDLALMLGWAVLVGLVAGALLSGGALSGVGPLGLHLTGIAAVVLPVTIGLTVLEAGRYEATPGKLRLDLRVRRDPGGERISWARSFLRNLLKLGLPWVLLHLAVITAVIGGGGTGAWAGVLLALVLPVAYTVSLYHGDGRTIYDHLSGTVVISTEPGRRFAVDDPEADAVWGDVEPGRDAMAAGPQDPRDTWAAQDVAATDDTWGDAEPERDAVVADEPGEPRHGGLEQDVAVEADGPGEPRHAWAAQDVVPGESPAADARPEDQRDGGAAQDSAPGR